MAAITGTHRGLRPAGWRVLACSLGFVASCSGTAQVLQAESSPQAESTSLHQAPTNTVYVIESETDWSVGIDEPPEAPDDLLLYLAPTPVDGVDIKARLSRANAGGVPEYSMVVEWPNAGLSVQASPTVACIPLPDGQRWRSVRIRDVPGCESTNGAGLYFAIWVEDETRFTYSSFDITGSRARKMLDDWEPLE